MNIGKDQIVQFLESQGHHDQAQQASQELPDQVDTDNVGSVGLVLAGVGSSVQHPRASLLVTNTYGANSRGPLGIYNFSGDLGKAIFPAVIALLLPVVAWRSAVGVVAVVGLAAN